MLFCVWNSADNEKPRQKNTHKNKGPRMCINGTDSINKELISCIKLGTAVIGRKLGQPAYICGQNTFFNYIWSSYDIHLAIFVKISADKITVE